MATVRGRCEVLVGECQTGKKRIADWYVKETAATPARAAIMAESMASMRCRGGDSTERDRLLRAIYELSDGAYVNARKPAFCEERIKTIRTLGPKVPPRDIDDTQISGGQQALFYTA